MFKEKFKKMADKDYELSEEKLKKLELLRESGVNPYVDKFDITHSLKEVKDVAEGTAGVAIAGRIAAVRSFGNLVFVHLQDVEGRFQVALTKAHSGPQMLEWFANYVDIGDFIGCEGELFITQKGELTLRVFKLTLLSKSLLNLPEKWHGLKDVEVKYRKRFLDLVANSETRDNFAKCFKAVSEIRKFFDEYNFVEVYTPAMSPKPSGALAKPFVTHHNTLDTDMFLRIAPETYLKRLVVGGFNRVFEFARCFRNEGISPEHLQDFTMIEAYAAYWNYRDNMKFCREMIIRAVKNVLGTTKITFREHEIELDQPWEEASMRDLILRYSEIDINNFDTAASLLAEIKSKKIDLENPSPEKINKGPLIDLLYKRTARSNIFNPTFLVNHPIEISPLARSNDENPSITDRFQVLIGGLELINGYSELADPLEQEKRLLEQQDFNDAGDDEAMHVDYNFIEALSIGMPPTSGWGMSIERFFLMLTDSKNIRDVVLFPLMRED